MIETLLNIKRIYVGNKRNATKKRNDVANKLNTARKKTKAAAAIQK